MLVSASSRPRGQNARERQQHETENETLKFSLETTVGLDNLTSLVFALYVITHDDIFVIKNRAFSNIKYMYKLKMKSK